MSYLTTLRPIHWIYIPQDTETNPLALHTSDTETSPMDWSQCLASFPGSFPKGKRIWHDLGGGIKPWTFDNWNLCLKVSNSP